MQTFALTRYLGVPIHGGDGDVIGTLCFVDRSEETVSQQDIDFLTILATRASAEIVRERHIQKTLAVSRAHLAELEQANEHLQEANRRITRMIRTVAHELRNPLSRAATEAYLFRTARSRTERLESADAIERAVDCLIRLTNDLLDYSIVDADPGAMVLEAFAPAAMVEGVFRSFRPDANAKGLDLALEAESAPCRVWGDAMRVEQIVANLVSNALRCTDAGGVRVRIASSKGYWTVVVDDDGIGIPADDCGLIFEEFSSINTVEHQARHGTGLGLAICRRLCAAMGGAINVVSEVGRGSTFTVTLPIGSPLVC